ncbi:MAG: hypothetical protein ACRD5L_01800 [Bryobacteraceae bacterium]
MEKSNDKLMHNRRVTGVEHILEQQVAGLLPVSAKCGGGDPQSPGEKIVFFEGETQSMRFASTYSLQEGGRGMPKILEFQVIPGNEGLGVRLIVNEYLYSGPTSTGGFCTGKGPDDNGGSAPLFIPISVGPGSFVLADKLSTCQFAFLQPAKDAEPARWVQHWTRPILPQAIRITMLPLREDSAAMQLLPLTLPVHVTRWPLGEYAE